MTINAFSITLSFSEILTLLIFNVTVILLMFFPSLAQLHPFCQEPEQNLCFQSVALLWQLLEKAHEYIKVNVNPFFPLCVGVAEKERKRGLSQEQ